MTDSAGIGTDDPYLPLAFSMHSTPGAYAVLAGAGVSFGAVPTAWEIVVDLAQRICRVRGDEATAATLTGDTVEDWFATTFNKPLTYGGILAEVAPAPHERGAVLREFFESADASEVAALPEPTAAHRAIARLVADGTVRVIVTMNFDHLFEAALREVGVEPVVVATDSAAEGLPPLHTVECCVVHLHGSYRDASSMLNTDDELGTYKPHMHALLRDIVGSHGLLIAGWSAQWDHALRATLRGNYRPFYTSAWINPSPLKDDAREVATALGARAFEATADEAFTRLADAVTAMRTRQTRHPLTAAVIVDRIKRDLAGAQPAITAHDTFAAETGRLEGLDALNLTQFHLKDRSAYDALVAQIDEGCTVPVAATATLARWGTADTDRWWLPVIEQWAHVTRASGHTIALELPTLVATRLVYAGGLGAVAANRYDTLAQIFTVPTVDDRLNRSLLALTDWARQHSDINDNDRGTMRDRFTETVRDALGLSQARFDAMWQEFEVLRMTAQIMTAPEFRIYQTRAVQPLNAERAARLQEPDSGHHRQTITELDEALRPLSAMATSYRPHIEMLDTMRRAGGRERWISPVAQRLIERPDRNLIEAFGTLLHLDELIASESTGLSAKSVGSPAITRASAVTVTVALRATAARLNQLADQACHYVLHQSPPGGGMFLPNEVWLDDETRT
ncbi:SIR2 family protein [Gordonia paraffinivorans]|uniref:SIR2 family protein n=1 Tax=Gordonia paraffinivorans TaxID=175628 RepID=UPI001E5FB10D|nr:SIR2 family protein [Gordonia paraffinivorans]MCD2147398.1 SIR2 family protein [Gordonia paraffinivorans]